MYLKLTSNRENNSSLFGKVLETDFDYLQNKINEYVFKMAALVNKRAATKMEPNLDCIFMTGDQLQKIRMIVNFNSFGISDNNYHNTFVKEIVRKIQLIDNEAVKQKTYKNLANVGAALCSLVDNVRKITEVMADKKNQAPDFYDEIQHHLINSFTAIDGWLAKIEKDGLIKIGKKTSSLTEQIDFFLQNRVTKNDYKERE